MAQILVTPRPLLVSPAGAGTISFSNGTAGAFSGRGSSRFQNYRYIATPNAGYHFVKFLGELVEKSKFHYPDTPSADAEYQSTLQFTLLANYENGSFVAESDVTASGDMIQGGHGAAWWFAEDYEWEQYEYWIDSIKVTAIFRSASGSLVYSPNQAGRLVYSAAQGGALVYDG